MLVGDRPDRSQRSGRADDGQKDREDNRPLLSWRAALVIMAVGPVVLLAGGSLLVRQLTGSGSQQLGTVPQIQATPAAQVAAGPNSTLTAPSTTVPISRPGSTSEQPTALATTLVPGSSAVRATVTPAATAGLVASAPPDRAAEDEIAASYLHYWDVTTDAFWNLDTSKLNEVATGQELAQLGTDIERLRSEGRAIKTEVQHDYAVVQIGGNEAQIFDRYRDFSVYVDANTKQTLPGEARPSTPENAPLNSVLYHLQNEGGIWKVADGERYSNN